MKYFQSTITKFQSEILCKLHLSHINILLNKQRPSTDPKSGWQDNRITWSSPGEGSPAMSHGLVHISATLSLPVVWSHPALPLGRFLLTSTPLHLLLLCLQTLPLLSLWLVSPYPTTLDSGLIFSRHLPLTLPM